MDRQSNNSGKHKLVSQSIGKSLEEADRLKQGKSCPTEGWRREKTQFLKICFEGAQCIKSERQSITHIIQTILDIFTFIPTK